MSLKPADLRKAAIEMYGERAWQSRLAADLNVDTSSVRRWVSGAVPIPGPVSAAIQCLLREKRTGGT